MFRKKFLLCFLLDPQRAKGYDVRSDVWSLGITLIEISTGKFPYRKWSSVFDQLQQVVHGDPPRLEMKDSVTGRTFTYEFVNFVNTCLIKDETERPKYVRLLQDPFIRRAESEASAISMKKISKSDWKYSKMDPIWLSPSILKFKNL